MIEPSKKYPCCECGEMGEARSMWVCEDDKLRCGSCTDKRIDDLYRHREHPGAVQLQERRR